MSLAPSILTTNIQALVLGVRKECFCCKWQLVTQLLGLLL